MLVSLFSYSKYKGGNICFTSR